MPNPKLLFHYVSYVQYPLMLIALFYSVKPLLFGFASIWEDYNNILVFAGLGISFSTLQDTTKTQNKLSKRIWENPKSGKTALIFMSLFTLVIILSGLFGLYFSKNSIIKELSFGVIVFGIGWIGMIKAAIEMFEHHRKDKSTVASR